jgi:lactobin A/cerein 7B family class IIb bacteriocin
MKTMELEKMGLVELNSSEMTKIEGGRFPWGWLAVGLGVVAAIISLFCEK